MTGSGERRRSSLEHVQAARGAQIDVQHDQIGVALLEQAQRAGRVVGSDRLQPGPLERKRQQVDQLAVVVNEQDAHCAYRRHVRGGEPSAG